jgi:lipopolysaccharide export system protein LptA
MKLTQKHKKLFLVFLFPYVIYCSSTHHQSVNPLSKIVVTSTDAVCTKDAQHSGTFIFKYRNNVRVTLADDSSITADSLEIILDAKKSGTHKQAHSPDISNFKQIIFSGHVKLMSSQRKAIANSARVFLAEQRVELEGNVKLWQIKQKPSDIPVAIQSSRAEVSLLTGQVHLLGDALNPVSTTIVLRGHPSLQHKKKHEVRTTSHGLHSSSFALRST